MNWFKLISDGSETDFANSFSLADKVGRYPSTRNEPVAEESWMNFRREMDSIEFFYSVIGYSSFLPEKSKFVGTKMKVSNQRATCNLNYTVL